MNAKPQSARATNGFQLTFFTQQDHRHDGKALAYWLVDEARALGIGGATLSPASEGFGHHRRLHAVHILGHAEQPQEVVMAVTEDEANTFFARLKAEGIKIFYSKTPIEFGTTGDGS